MKKVMLIGDSIRLSYQQFVKERLDGLCEVVWPEDNCAFAKYTLWYINSWIEVLGKPDIIHWNNGIWDVYHINSQIGIFTPIEEYMRELGRILKELRRTGADLIWAKTTPVNDKCKVCRNEDIDRYNEAAAEFMRSEKIVINDLNSLIRNGTEEYFGEDYLHLNEAGQKRCAEAVAEILLKYL